MKFKKLNIEKMISQLDDICDVARKLEDDYASIIKTIHQDKQSSAINLLHYLALRHHDISKLQEGFAWDFTPWTGRKPCHG